jgi:hypothetical protein
VAFVSQQRGLLLGACERNAEFILVLAQYATRRQGPRDQGLNSGVIKDLVANAIETSRPFVRRENLHRPDAVATDGSEQVERVGGFGPKFALEPTPYCTNIG